MEIQFKVNEQTVKKTNNPDPANLSQKYLKLCFDFETEDWEDVTKFALFTANNVKYRVALVEDKVIVPNACLQGNTFSFSVYGLSDDEMRITTNQLYVHLAESGYTTGVENDISPDDPTIVEQIYIDMATAQSAAETYADNGLALKVDKTVYDAKILELVDAIASKDIGIVKQSSADTGYFATYYITQGGEQLSPKINIPKDYLLKSASLKQCTVKDEPIEGLNVGDWYFDWVLNTADETEETHLYLNANVLTDVYEADGETIIITDNVISVKPNVFADKVHTHTKSDITDFTHNHDDRYYTESEVNTIIKDLKHDLSNYFKIDTDKPVIQTGELSDIKIRMVENNFPVGNKDIYFYERYEPSITMSSDKSIIQVDEVADVTARLKDEDGSLVQDTPIYFYIEDEEDENVENMEDIPFEEENNLNDMEDESNDSEL